MIVVVAVVMVALLSLLRFYNLALQANKVT